MSMMSIIIPVLNEEKIILDCLKSLSTQSISREEYEIIVVDGGSSDHTCEIAVLLADKVISQKRAGIGGARRDGVEEAIGDILVFTDADTRHPYTWLEKIRLNLTNSGYDVCTGPVRFYDETIHSFIIQGWRQQYILLHAVGFYWLIGSNFAVKKDIYLRAGGHRSISILEDYDLSRRLTAANALCIYDRRIGVLTSSRRMSGTFRYMWIYLNGFYHYHITRNDEYLLKYPHPQKLFHQFAKYSNLKLPRRRSIRLGGK